MKYHFYINKNPAQIFKIAFCNGEITEFKNTVIYGKKILCVENDRSLGYYAVQKPLLILTKFKVHTEIALFGRMESDALER